MKRQLAALALGTLLLTPAARGAFLTLDGAPLAVEAAPVYDWTTYVPRRAVAQALIPDAAVIWSGDHALVQWDDFLLSARPGDHYLTYNETRIDCSGPVRLESGRTLVPVRALAAALGAGVDWDAATGTVALTTRQPSQDAPDALFWLSRIISAESRGEPLEGKIAVGNVVLNRVKSPDFPDTIYGVIFDDRWGGQFEPVRNGTVYDEPTAESVEAARLCLEGVNTAGDSLYFLAPHLTDNHWTMENRTYVTTIGCHWFYQ